MSDPEDRVAAADEGGLAAIVSEARLILHASPGKAMLEQASSDLAPRGAAYMLASAACDLAIEMLEVAVRSRDLLETPADLAKFLSVKHYVRDRELFGVVCLDGQMRYLGDSVEAVGAKEVAVFTARNVFSAAIKRDASGVVLFHTHPNGNPEPSAEDLETTKGLVAIGAKLNVRVLDHIILVEGGEFHSMRAHGDIRF